MDALRSGMEYELLPDSYVIFICDFDPVGAGKYVYTEEKRYQEAPEYPVQDGHHTSFLSTRGKNREEVPASLVRFLEFVKADSVESEKDFGDGFVRRLQESVRQVRASREMGNVICGGNWHYAMKELLEEPGESSPGWRRAYWIFCWIWAMCPKSCVSESCPSGMLRCCRSF